VGHYGDHSSVVRGNALVLRVGCECLRVAKCLAALPVDSTPSPLMDVTSHGDKPED